MTDLEREELETYRMKSENGQIAAYYLLAEELGVKPGGGVVDTVHARIHDLEKACRLARKELAHWVRDHGHDIGTDEALCLIDSLIK